MELSRQRVDLLLKEGDVRRRREATEACHLDLCEQIHAALAGIGSAESTGIDAISLEKVQELVRNEGLMRNDIMVLKDEYLRMQNHVQNDLDLMEHAHDTVVSKLGRENSCGSTRSPFFDSPTSCYSGKLAESLTNYLPEESTAMPVEGQMKSQNLKSAVGAMMGRVSENTRRIERERQQSMAENKPVERLTVFSEPSSPRSRPTSPMSPMKSKPGGLLGNIDLLDASADRNPPVASPSASNTVVFVNV